MKQETMRSCIGCGAKKPKKELIRVVRQQGETESEIHLDFTGRSNGRGAYLCRDNTCLKRCQKTRGLDRAFREHVNDSVYAALEKEFTKLNEGHGEADGSLKT